MGAQISKRFQTLERDCKKPSSKRSKRSKESHSQEVSIKDQEIRGHDQAYSHIETLPRELIWMIMEYAPAVLLELAVASRAMNARVIEFAQQRKAIPMIEELVIHSGKSPKSYSLMFKIFVPWDKSMLFQLRMILRRCPSVQISRFNRVFDSKRDCWVYSFKFSARNMNERTLEFVRDIVRGRIQKLTLEISSSSKGLRNAIGIFGGTKIYRLRSNEGILSNVGAITIQRLVTLCKVEQLFMLVTYTTIEDPAQFLTHLSSSLRRIWIYQPIDDERFLNIDDGELAHVIIEMFSRKLDNLIIHSGAPYLSDATVDILSKRLPYLGKNVWLHAIGQAIYGQSKHVNMCTNNGHVINAFAVGDRFFKLSIAQNCMRNFID